MKSETRMSKCSESCNRWFRHSDFVIRHSGLRIAVCFIQKAGRCTGESGLGVGWFMKSPDAFDAVHWDHERRISETVPPRCCRHLAGSAFLGLVCRQDAGSTPGSMERTMPCVKTAGRIGSASPPAIPLSTPVARPSTFSRQIGRAHV